MVNIENLTDKELYEKCRFYGASVRNWTKKFGALLFEVERRQLYKKYGFYSIFEFAAKLAGMKHETVIDILRVSRKLDDKPLLKVQMASVGWGKLRIVSTIATPENEKMLAEKVVTMSAPTLAAFVREIRKQNEENVQNRIDSAGENTAFLASGTGDEMEQKELFRTAEQDGEIGEVRAWQKVLPSRVQIRINLKLETDLRFRELQKKLSKKYGGPVDFDEVLETLLDAYEDSGKKTERKNQAREKSPKVEENSKTSSSINKKLGMPKEKTVLLHLLEQKEEENLAVLEQKAREKVRELELNNMCSHYVPAAIRKYLYEKYHGRCAFMGCIKLQEIYHHTRRYGLNPSHDPDFLIPLCKEHERLAHHGLIENEEKAPSEWRILAEADKANPKYFIDQKVQGFRRPK